MGSYNELISIRNEIKDIPGINKKPAGGVGTFSSRIGSALALGFREKEIFVFALLQWIAIGLAYVLWVQMLAWIPEEVWRSAEDAEGTSVADVVLLAWTVVCIVLAAFPVGILTGCMGATHFLHKQGRTSTVAMCMKLALPQSWALWSFHSIDGLITVKRIVDRLPKKKDRTSARRKALAELLYYAWKLAVAGVLPSIVTGNTLLQSARNSVGFVKDNFLEVAKLRAGYSALCWIVGLVAYVGAILFFVSVDAFSGQDDVAGGIGTFYLWAGVPILVATSVVMLVLRPIYVLALCELYSEHLEKTGETVHLPETPPKAVSALVVFFILCLLVGMVYLYRVELGIVDMLSTPFTGQ